MNMYYVVGNIKYTVTDVRSVSYVRWAVDRRRCVHCDCDHPSQATSILSEGSSVALEELQFALARKQIGDQKGPNFTLIKMSHSAICYDI